MYRSLRELALLFLKLGAVGFGGPAVHLAQMEEEEEIVRRHSWLTHGEFLDPMGAANLIPGPNSTEMAMHIGYRRAGLVGLIVAGACFILPAVLVTVGFAWLYVQLGRFPHEQVALLLGGIQAAMMAVIMAALFELGKRAFKTFYLTFLGSVTGLAALLWPRREVRVLLIAAAAGAIGLLLWKRWKDRAGDNHNSMLVGPLPLAAGTVAVTGAKAPASPRLLTLGLFF